MTETIGRHGRNQIIVVLGRIGSGKSTAVGRITQDLKKRSRKMVISLDWLGDQEFPFDTVECESLELRDTIQSRPEENAIIVYDGKEPNTLQTMMRVSRQLDGVQNYILVVDELDFPAWCTSSMVDAWTAKVIKFGRHDNVDLIAASRRPQDIPKLLLAQASTIAVGNLATPREAKQMEEFGFDPEQIGSLPVGSFIVRSLEPATGKLTFTKQEFKKY